MKIDLHNHSYYSNDGCSSLEKMIKTAKRKGLDGIAITDHNTTEGWEEAKEVAKKHEIFLVLGQEIKTKKNGKATGDLLGLFLKEKIKSIDLNEAIKEIKAQNGIAVIPHPFHWFTPFKAGLEKYSKIVDAIEVINARIPIKSVDKKALEFAEKRGLAIVASSDSHFSKDVGDAYTIADNAKNLEDFREAILNKKTRVKGKKTNLISLIAPVLARLKIIGHAPKKK